MTQPNAMDERLYNSRFMKATRGEPTDCTPVWLMRQAGRYMQEYRDVRSKVQFIDLCKKPELSCEVTVTAQERIGADAAILFADLLPILEPMGLDLEYIEGKGPTIHNPVTTPDQLDRVKVHNARETMPFTAESVRQIRAALKPDIPLIGFAGLPFTLAAYSIEGGGSKNYAAVKTFMYSDAGAWNALLEKFVETLIPYCLMQIEAGAQAFQFFDSWVGSLSPNDYREYVKPHVKRVFDGVRAGMKELGVEVPLIHFGVGTATFLADQHECGGDVLGMDWHTPISQHWDQLPGLKSVQGNLDPLTLYGPQDTLLRKAQEVLDDVGGRAGHIFNLGHGILPKTPVDNVIALIDYVHEKTAR